MTQRADSRLGPVPGSERSLSPDLARGAMLLLIALAHTRILHPGGAALARPGGAGPLDGTVQVVMTVLVDGRAYPMFAALFGFGLVQMFRRGVDRGLDGRESRRLLRRRGGWLVAFGVAHAALLYAGDILAAYGLLAVLLAGAVDWSGRRLAWTAGISAVLGAMWFGGLQLAIGTYGEPPLAQDLLQNAAQRLHALFLVSPMSAMMAVAPLMAGIWAARRGVLDHPEQHRRLLSRTAAIGLAGAVAGALPTVALLLGLWDPESPTTEWLMAALHTLSGNGGGLAYAAIIGLIVTRIRAHRGVLTTALAACGQRSMTCYLLQSVAWFVLTEPALGDLGAQVGVAVAAGIGTLVWVATVLIAVVLDRAHLPGPAEALLRRLTYRRRRTPRAPRRTA